MVKEYYFISDLHIGGDGEMNVCDYEDELTIFLKELESKNKETELIILGDMFGFWEITNLEVEDKLNYILKNHKNLFQQFKKTGQNIIIRLIVGNHDFQLLCYDRFEKELEEFNIKLEKNISKIIEINGKKIWIEHGNQYEATNYIANYKDPNALPIAYHGSQSIISGAHRNADKGRREWLKEINSVHPKEAIPHWTFTNYFYKEMHPILRVSIVPYLVFFMISFLFLIISWFQNLGWIDIHYLSREAIKNVRFIGNALNIILYINITIILAFLFLAVPLYFILQDIRRSLKRYGLIYGNKLQDQKNEKFTKAAKKIFQKNPEISTFIFGHTHKPEVKKIGHKVIINTGTWLKKLQRIKSRFKLLPSVYYPYYQIGYFHLHSKGKQVLADYHKIEKEAENNLTTLQRFAIAGKKYKDKNTTPKRTII